MACGVTQWIAGNAGTTQEIPVEGNVRAIAACILRDMGAPTPSGLSDEKASRMMAGFRLGSTLNQFREKSPRFNAYCRVASGLCAQAKALLAENLKASNARKGAARRALTHCKYGHPLSGDNLYLAPGRKERKCLTCLKRRSNSPSPASDDEIRSATAALNAGKTISEICWGKVDGRKVTASILSFRKLKLHREQNPDYDRFVVSAMADHNSKGQLRRFNREKVRGKTVCGKSAPKTWVHHEMTDSKAMRILPGLRAGLTLRQLGEVPRRFECYCDAHPEYTRDARPLEAANAEAARLRKGAHIRNKTHCINGHLFAKHGRVAIHKGWKTRQCRACETMRSSRGGVIRPEVLEKVTARIVAGASLSSFVTAGKAGYLVGFSTLARYRRENPDFDRFVIDASKDNNIKGQKLRWQRVRNASVRDQNNDYYRIRAMLPESFPDKDDVIGAIFEDLLSGNVRREDIRTHIKKYIAAYNRMFPTMFAKFGNAKLVSLDAKLYEDGATTLGDMVSRGLWD